MFERTSAHLVQPPNQSRVRCEVVQGFIQLSLEKLQRWRLYNVSGQLAPLVDCSHGGKVFPCVRSDPLISTHTYWLLSSHPAPL